MVNRTETVMGAVAGVALAGTLLMAQPAQEKKGTAPKAKWTAEQVLPFTCAQAWVESGKTYPGMLAIVETLARVSLANRDLTFPDTREAGLDAGKAIVADCTADPDDLLFAIVDKHVRRIAGAAAGEGP